MESSELKRKARRAYELGRLVNAGLQATASLVVVGLAVMLHGPHAHVLALGVIAVGLYVLAGWAHGDFLGGAQLGLGLGLVQLLAALFMTTIGMRLVPHWCQEICFGIVLMGSSFIGALYAKRFADDSFLHASRSALAMFGIGSAMAFVGCLPGSVGLLSGSAIGLLAGLGPGWALARTRMV